MPIYMDRHNVPEFITAENIAQMHQQDLKVQHLFKCRALTYWYDDKRKTAFCLFDAPHAKNIAEMHNHAHGQVPHEIIEVDASLVESFLGRIEDPTNDNTSGLHIINDPAFRTIMVMRFIHNTLQIDGLKEAFLSKEEFVRFANSLITTLDANIVKQSQDEMLISFKSVVEAVDCAIKLQTVLTKVAEKFNKYTLQLNIGLSAGLPLTGQNSLFETNIQLSSRLSDFSVNKILLTSAVKDLYRSEKGNNFNESEQIVSLSAADKAFVNQFMGFIEANWHNHDLRVNDFNRPLGMSKSQLYRKMMELIGRSPAVFLKEYRLNRAFITIHKKHHNVSQIAYDTGFSSLSYFSKCFRKRYGLLPSEILQPPVN